MTRILLFLFLLSSLVAGAQERKLVARDFRELPNDMTAKLHGTNFKDNKGKDMGLLKIYTPIPLSELGFDGTVYGVHNRQQHGPGEIWVYLPERTMKMTFVTSRYGDLPVSFESLGMIRSGHTYALNLNVEGKPISLVASANGAAIEVDGEPQGNSPVNIYLPYGSHIVTARQGGLVYEDVIFIKPDGPDEYNLKLEDEKLKYADVTFKVPEGVEIWFDNRRQGVGEYTVRLREGDYSVETRKKDCAPIQTVFSVTPGKAQIVEPEPPVPYRGFLEIATMPETGVDIFRGDSIFTRERTLSLPVGKYELTYRKKGYEPLTRVSEVRWGETTLDSIVLQKRQYLKSSTLYAGVGFVALPDLGVAFHLGGLWRNILVDAAYTLIPGRTDAVSWYGDEDNILAYTADYRRHEIQVLAGYRLSFAQRFGLTPELGWRHQWLDAPKGQPGDNFSISSLALQLQAIYQPLPNFGVFIAPQYALPLVKKGDSEELFRLAGVERGGFRLEVGVQFNL